MLSSITKKGRLKASRLLIRVLVINDNSLWITISFEIMSIGRSTDERELVVNVWIFGNDEQSSGSRQRYKIGILYFTGHKVFSG